MISNYEILFENKSNVSEFRFWSELGITTNIKVIRLAPGQSLMKKVFADNAWSNFEKVVYQDVTAAGGEIKQIIKTTPRKGHKQELTNGGVFLKVNLDVDINQGRNLPSLLQAYIMESGEQKMNMLVGLKHKIEVPKNTFPAQFNEITMSVEEHISEDDYIPNRIFNTYRLRFDGKKSDEELRKIGILKK